MLRRPPLASALAQPAHVPLRKTLPGAARAARAAFLAIAAAALVGVAHADVDVSDSKAQGKLDDIKSRIGSGNLNRTTSDVLKEIQTRVANLGFSATLTPGNQLQKISDTSGYVQQACPSQGGALGGTAAAGGASPNVTSLATINAGNSSSVKQQICQQLIQLETHGFTRMNENLNYSGERLLKVFPGRNGMDTLEKANAVAAGGPEKVAEAIYGGDWGKKPGTLGNTQPGDGWKYHGRGFTQLTGRDNYAHYGEVLGLDLVNHSDLAAEPANAAKIATQYWKERVVALGHQHDITHATKDINGHYNGLAERKAAAAHWETKLARGYKPGDPEPGQSLQDSPLYKQAHAAIQNIDARFCRKPDQLTANAAAVVAVATHKAGFTRIDHLELGGADNSKIFAVQGKLGTVHSKIVDVPTAEAMHTPIAQSAQAFAVAQQAGQHAPTQHLEPAIHQSLQQTAPALSR